MTENFIIRSRSYLTLNPAVKMGMYFLGILVAIAGESKAAVGLAMLTFAWLLILPERRSFLRNPWFFLAICGAAIVPDVVSGVGVVAGSVSLLAVRMIAVICVTLVFFRSICICEIIALMASLRIRPGFMLVLIGFARFAPIAIDAFEQVILAQKSRGLTLPWGLFSPRNAKALAIPLLLAFARAILSLWVAVNLRADRVAAVQPVIFRGRDISAGLALGLGFWAIMKLS